MQKFPLELRRNILDDICIEFHRNDLLPLRTTCKEFETFISAHTFRTLRFTSSVDDTMRLQNLANSTQRVAELVQNIEIEIVDEADDPEEDFSMFLIPILSITHLIRDPYR